GEFVETAIARDDLADTQDASGDEATRDPGALDDRRAGTDGNVLTPGGGKAEVGGCPPQVELHPDVRGAAAHLEGNETIGIAPDGLENGGHVGGGLSIDGEDAVTRLQAGYRSGAADCDVADGRRCHVEAFGEDQQRQKRPSKEDVDEGAGEDDGRPL